MKINMKAAFIIAVALHAILLGVLLIRFSLDKPTKPNMGQGDIMHATFVPPAKGNPNGTAKAAPAPAPAPEPEETVQEDTSVEQAKQEMEQRLQEQKAQEQQRQEAIALQKKQEIEKARKLKAEADAKAKAAAAAKAKAEADSLEGDILGTADGDEKNGQGLGSGGGGGDGGYGDKVRGLIEQNWRVDQSMNGKKVVVSIKVTADGTVTDESCQGDEKVCQSALDAIRMVGMFPRPPATCPECSNIKISMTPKL